MGTPFLTIGIASYNYAKWLMIAFEAIQRQTFKDFEILYCDDGSTDESVAVIQKIIQNHPNMSIRLVQGKNGGVMENKNRILDHARGEYVMLCDADDWMQDNCLELLCNAAKSTGADQVAGAFQNVDENGHILQVQEIPKHPVKWTWGIHHATIYKMSVIQKYHLRMSKEYYPDDVYFNLLFHEHSGETVFINDILYNWCVHDDSASSRKAQKSNWTGYAMLKSILPYMRNLFDEQQNVKDWEELEYMACKIYALAVFYRYTGGNFNDFFQEYKLCEALMAQCFDKYLWNPALRKIDGNGYVRKRSAHIIWGLGFLERTHLIRPALWGYWKLSHFIKMGI